jgi:hypothetical protein
VTTEEELKKKYQVAGENPKGKAANRLDGDECGIKNIKQELDAIIRS